MRTIGVALALLVLGSCEEDLPRFGAGHYCQRDDQCLEGLVCVARECSEPPAARSGPHERLDGGRDAGASDASHFGDASAADAGPLDAAVSVDAGAADAGEEPDGGADPDGGPDPDAATPPDAASDAAPSDASS